MSPLACIASAFTHEAFSPAGGKSFKGDLKSEIQPTKPEQENPQIMWINFPNQAQGLKLVIEYEDG